MKKRIAFIINPVSGLFDKKRIPLIIQKKLDKTLFEPEIIFTEYAGHGTELTADFVKQGFDCVVAVGGDGTVNEVALELLHTNTALGIIPIGSGNGLARHLGVSLNVTKAIKQLNESRVVEVDYGLLNDKPFFCTCGIGFDAYVSAEFHKVKLRGSVSYLRKIIPGFIEFKSQNYHIECGAEKITTKAFFITFGNASQWGNNAHVTPRASMKDGLLNVTILKKLPLHSAAWLGVKLFTKLIDDGKYIKTFVSKEFTVRTAEENKKMIMQLDGEPFGAADEARIRVVHNGLKVFCSKDFQ